MNEPAFPALERLLAIYLNEDWVDDYTDEWAALAAFVAEAPSAAAALLPAEIALVLDSHRTETDLEAFLDSLANGYAADWDGGTYRGWLEEVARRVEAATA